VPSALAPFSVMPLTPAWSSSRIVVLAATSLVWYQRPRGGKSRERDLHRACAGPRPSCQARREASVLAGRKRGRKSAKGAAERRAFGVGGACGEPGAVAGRAREGRCREGRCGAERVRTWRRSTNQRPAGDSPSRRPRSRIEDTDARTNARRCRFKVCSSQKFEELGGVLQTSVLGIDGVSPA
jgi:hypothetical protein